MKKKFKNIIIIGLVCIIIISAVSTVAAQVIKSKKKSEHVHDYNKMIVKSTCEEEGYTKYICECGDFYQDNYKSPKCSWDWWEVLIHPTPNSSGIKKRSCLICGNEEVELISSKNMVDTELLEINCFVNMTENSKNIAKLIINKAEECYKNNDIGEFEPVLILSNVQMSEEECNEIYRNLSFYYGFAQIVEHTLMFEPLDENTYSIYMDKENAYILEEERYFRLLFNNSAEDYEENVQSVVDAIIKAVNKCYEHKEYIDEEYLDVGRWSLTDVEYRKVKHELCKYFAVSSIKGLLLKVLCLPYVEAEISISTDAAYIFEQNRRALMQDIDDELETLSKRSEKTLSKNIFKYLVQKLTYDKNQCDAINGFQTLSGNSEVYSTLFQLMLYKVGIESDICIARTEEGEYHTYNVVYFSDGDVRYYDLAMYEITGDKEYFNSPKNFDAIFTINDYFSLIESSMDLYV
ncbi:MAG: hypothetical protein E7314_01420 [Clostridiales bacterium]|nr:hypothetical protein [Clostridiales bacterium]